MKQKNAGFFKRLHCRSVQFFLKIVLPFTPNKTPKLLEGVADVPSALKAHGKKHPLLVTGKTVRGLGLTAPLEAALKEAGLFYTVYDGTSPNPTIDNAEEGYKLYLSEGCDSLIGFGGGSPLDCAKCIGARVARPKKPLQKMGGVLKVKKKIPLLVAIPTTAGTGSETSPAAVVIDSETQHKYAVTDFKLVPSYAVLDETLCASLPKHTVAATGIDALTHAIEAYINHGALGKRDALEAIKLIFENLEKSYAGDMSAKKHMLLASNLAGRAFSRAYVGYVHALAHALGGKYNVSHGLANAIILPLVLREYGKAIYKKLWKVARYCNLADKTTPYREGAQIIIDKIEAMNSALGIGNTIEEIRLEDLDTLAAFADKEANPFYPVPVIWDKKRLKGIYLKLSGKNDQV